MFGQHFGQHSMNAALMYMGTPVFESPFVMTLKSGKPLARKSWHRDRCYPKRVAKKWARVFGPIVMAPGMMIAANPFGMGKVIFAHPTIVEKLRLELVNR